MEIQGVHTWRQSQTMWNIRNFARHDANILNPRVSHFNGNKDNIYRYEFPIMQWIIGMFQRLFSEQILWVRLFMFLFGSLGVVGMFFLLKHLTGNELTALISALLFQYSPVFYYYTINPMPDILALSAAIWYTFFILKFIENKKKKYIILAGIALLISTCAKLPFLMYSIISIVYFATVLYKEKRLGKSLFAFAFIQLIFVLPALIWYAWVMPGWEGNPILKGVFEDGLILKHNFNIIRYNLLKNIPQKLLSPPVWLLFFAGIYYCFKQRKFLLWLFALSGITLLYLILESSAIDIGHDYYLFPFLPWLFIVVGYGTETIRRLHLNLKYLLIAVCILSACYTSISTKSMWSLKETIFNSDVFIYREDLKNAAPRDAKCIIMNDESNYVFSYQIDKMGYIFKNDYLPEGWIDDMIKNHNVRYLYSDSKKINADKTVSKFIEKLILVRGSVKVFKLKKVL